MQFDSSDNSMFINEQIHKNAQATTVLLASLCRDEYHKVSGLDNAKQIFNNLWHETIEECHNQCVDVRTIDVGIGHDDNLVVAQLFSVSLLRIFAIYTEADSDMCSTCPGLYGIFPVQK